MTVNEIENISETRIEKEGREGEGEGEEQEQQCESINQGASFSLVWSSGIDVFKRIIKTLGKLEGEGEITFKVTKDGLFYRQMDRSHVSLIDLYFSSEDFESFQCMREGKFTICSQDLIVREGKIYWSYHHRRRHHQLRILIRSTLYSKVGEQQNHSPSILQWIRPNQIPRFQS